MPQARVTTSFVLPHDKLEALKKRLPKKGERSFVIEKLVEMFLANKIKVEVASRVY
jgi:hypothetical protein